jgi:formylglycine-generating enzyme required for sulfatase activity
MNRLTKSMLIGVGALVITTVGIGASDVANNVRGGLAGLVIDSTVIGPCSLGATLVQLGETTLCVDIYEASAGPQCPSLQPTNEIDTQNNIQAEACKATSAEGNEPWRFVSLTEAQQLCARDGKRLMKSEEWYKLASGMTNFDTCNIDSKDNDVRGGVTGVCTSPSGINDLVGNVWEWLDEEVIDGNYNGRALPSSGYVTSVDSTGLVVTTEDKPDKNFGDDYAFTSQTGIKGIIRGGFYGSRNDSGIFALNASINLDLRTAGVGFRCVKDVY